MHHRRSGALRELRRGASAFLEGLGVVVRTPGLLGWALFPAAVAVGIGITLTGAGIWVAMRVSEGIIHGGEAPSAFGRVLLDLLFGGVAVFAAVAVALAVAQPLTRVALDRIVTPLDSPRRPVAHSSSGLLQSLVVALSALGVTLPALGVLELTTLFAPEAGLVTEPVAVGISALALAWQLLDHPFSRRGLTIGERLRWMKGRFFAVLGFAAAAQVFLLIPRLDFFLLPVGIAGATRLFAQSEEEDEERRASPVLPPREPGTSGSGAPPLRSPRSP
jgi:uncharacterized protein involved in cysteine biosynthesis